MTVQLKTDPKYGYYPWWPEDGNQWVHPEDVELARSVIPSPRVWRRDGQRGDFVVLAYGDLVLRVRRTLWRELPWEGYDIGNLVEVRTRGMTNEHRTGTITEMHWDEHSGQVKYQLHVPDEEVENPINYARDDLKRVDPPDARVEVRFEASKDGDAYDVQEST